MGQRKKPVKQESAKQKFWPYGLLAFFTLLVIDWSTKHYIVTHYALGESHRMLSGMWFTYVQNTGTNWGILNGANFNWAFIYLSIIAFGLLVFFFDQFKTTIEKISYALIMVGLWGNLLDRIAYGFVVDFIDFRWWPVFNIADSCIVVAITLLLLEQWRKSRVTA